MTKRRILGLAVTIAIVLWFVSVIAFNYYESRLETVGPLARLTPYREDMNLREAFETLPASGGKASLRLLDDNNAAWAARWELLDKARETIDVSYFILRQDVFGVAFLSHLLKKAEEGVKVRILLDAFGSRLSWDLQGNDYLDALVNTGNAEIRMYRPLERRVVEGLLSLSLAVAVASEHDKMLVVDGRYALTGGRNIGIEYFAHPEDAEPVHSDLDLEIADRQVAAAMTRAFETQYDSDDARPITRERLDLMESADDLARAYETMNTWMRDKAAAKRMEATLKHEVFEWAKELQDMKHLQGYLARPLAPYLEAEARVIDSTARFDAPIDSVSEAATRLVKSSRGEIFIQNPYLVITDETVDLFAGAARRGVPITVFTNSPASTDSVASQVFFLEQWPLLLKRIPNLRLYANAGEQMIHAKLATFDQVVSLVGTYNLEPLSMATNSEVVVAVWSREFAAALTENPRATLAAGEPQVYRYRIALRDDGTPQLDDDGNPIIAFGPEDHADLDNMHVLEAGRKILQALDKVPGVSPFF